MSLDRWIASRRLSDDVPPFPFLLDLALLPELANGRADRSHALVIRDTELLTDAGGVDAGIGADHVEDLALAFATGRTLAAPGVSGLRRWCGAWGFAVHDAIVRLKRLPLFV